MTPTQMTSRLALLAVLAGSLSPGEAPAQVGHQVVARLQRHFGQRPILVPPEREHDAPRPPDELASPIDILHWRSVVLWILVEGFLFGRGHRRPFGARFVPRMLR